MSCSAATSPSPPTRSGSRPRPPSRPPARATSCSWRTSGSTRARRPRPTTSGPSSPRRSPRSADVFVSDGFGVVHRKQASVYDVARLLPHATGGLVVDRGRRAQAAHREPRPAVCGRARWRQGVRQARRHRQPARHRRPAAHRRRDGVHLPQGPGPRGRQEPARGGPARHRARATSTRRRPRASRSSCRSTSSRPPRSPRTPTTRSSRPTRSPPTGSGWTSDRSPRRCSPRS